MFPWVPRDILFWEREREVLRISRVTGSEMRRDKKKRGKRLWVHVRSGKLDTSIDFYFFLFSNFYGIYRHTYIVIIYTRIYINIVVLRNRKEYTYNTFQRNRNCLCLRGIYSSVKDSSTRVFCGKNLYIYTHINWRSTAKD